ncbi:MAG: PAS domain-containing sensor histidine kinase [Pseudomonadota bacterium]
MSDSDLPVGSGTRQAPPLDGAELRQIADSVAVLIWMTGLDRKRSFVNQAYMDFLGLDFDAAREFDWRTSVHPEDAAQLLAASSAGEAGMRPFQLEARYRRADGAWRWLRSTSQPRFDANGNHVGFAGVAHDITESKEAEIALREREALLSALVGQSTAGFAQVDLDGNFTLVNDRFCDIAGWSSHELLGRTMQSITHPDDLVRNVPLFQRIVADGTPYTHEKRYIRKDGSIVWVSNSVSLIRRADGSRFGVLAVTLDITGRRESEALARRSAKSVQLAVESAGMATWELDLATMAGEWSANRFDLLGLPRSADRTGSFQDWLNRVHPDDRDEARDAALRCFKEGRPYSIEYRIVRGDTGEERWLQSHGTRIDDDSGEVHRFVGISFDITERKLAEERLRTSEERYRTIFEQANDFLVTADLDLNLLSVNPAVLAALGYREDEMIGQPAARFVKREGMEAARAALELKLREGGSTRTTITMLAADGSERIWESISTLMFDKNGKPVGLQAISRDMTEAKQYEAHQRLLIDELNHRVKNSLAIVQGIAHQTFKADSDPIKARAAFEGRLAALSEAHNLLTREHWAPVAMRKVIGDAVAPHAGSSARADIDGPDLMIAPKTAISLALTIHELATNAVKHGALSCPEGRVTIRWQVETPPFPGRLKLQWIESGGPEVVPPTKRGFGTRMIERGLAAELGGTVKIDFERRGLICSVDAPLPEIDA